MVTSVKNKPILEEEIEEPEIVDENEEVNIEVPDGSQVTFKRSDFTCDGAWDWLINGKELDEDAFIDEANWWRYWLLAMKLTEGTVCCYGEERSGKSLWATFIAKQLKDLFGKQVTANTHLKGEGFGAYEYLDPASDFQREMDNLHKLAENSEGMNETQIAKGLTNNKIHNRCIIIDEAQEVVGKDRRTNLSRGLGMMNRLYGHLHNLTIYLSQDMEDFDKRMVWNRKTHEVICGFETMYEDTCTYIVRHKKGFSRMMHIQPNNWKHLWDTHELRGLSTGGKIRL
jgi:hypothetical protein